MNFPIAALPIIGSVVGSKLIPSSAHILITAALSIRKCAAIYLLLNASISAREEPALFALVCLALASLRVKLMTARVKQAAIMAEAFVLTPCRMLIVLLLSLRIAYLQ
jgi:hypothetical protein